MIEWPPCRGCSPEDCGASLHHQINTASVAVIVLFVLLDLELLDLATQELAEGPEPEGHINLDIESADGHIPRRVAEVAQVRADLHQVMDARHPHRVWSSVVLYEASGRNILHHVAVPGA